MMMMLALIVACILGEGRGGEAGERKGQGCEVQAWQSLDSEI
jgi:hypothetical protein